LTRARLDLQKDQGRPDPQRLTHADRNGLVRRQSVGGAGAHVLLGARTAAHQQRAVRAAEVDDERAVVGRMQLEVMSGDGGVVDADDVVGVASDVDDHVIEQRVHV
jgi:hypothetical protein